MAIQTTSKSDCPATQHLLKSSRTLSNPGKQLKPSLWRQYQNSWYPEVAALTLSASCVVAIAVILDTFDGKPNLRMKWGLTLNAVISILATTSKVSLIFTISNSIGQLKWVWFLGKKPRSLRDVGVYDDASRGPLGSLMLLFTEASSSTASIGALLTLLALAYDPFIQQIVSFEASSQLPDTFASDVVIHAAHSYLVDVDLYSDTNGTLGSLRPAINAAYWNNDFAWNVSCPSQNCTWPNFETLAWHTTCYKDKNWTLSGDCDLRSTISDVANLPFGEVQSLNCAANAAGAARNLSIRYMREVSGDLNELDLQYNFTELTITPTFELPFHNHVTNTSAPIISLSAFTLGAHINGSLMLNVTTCELDLFLDVYSLNSTNGIPFTKLLSSANLIKYFQEDACDVPDILLTNVNALYFYPTVCPDAAFFAAQGLNGSTGLPIQTNDHICLAVTQASAVNAVIEELKWNLPLQMNYTTYWVSEKNATTDTDSYNAMFESVINDLNMGTTAISASNEEVYIWKDKGPGYVMNNIAASLTKTMMDPTQNVYGTNPINGTASVPVTLVRVTWLWVLLPFGICLSSILFFLATVYVTFKSGAPLWKSSINAFFYHGIDIDFGIQTPLSTVPEINAQAARTRARLAPVGIFERLMLETTISKSE